MTTAHQMKSPDQFELNVAPHASGRCLSRWEKRVDLRVMIEEGVPRWMKEQG